MNPTVRKFLFYGLMVVFVVAGAYLVLETRGLTFDPRTFAIVKTGGVYLRYTPTDASLTMNGKSADKSMGFLSSGVLLNNLVPGRYSLTLTRTGYRSWTKTVTVAPGSVAAESNIVLWRAEPEVRQLGNNIADFWVTRGGFITEDASGTLAFGAISLPGATVVVADKDFPYVVTRSGNRYYLVNTETPESPVNLSALIANLAASTPGLPPAVPIVSIIPHPFSDQKLLIQSTSSVYALDFKKSVLEPLIEGPALKSVSAEGSDLVTLDASSTLTVMNLIFRTSSRYPLATSTDWAKVALGPSGGLIALETGSSSLWLFDRSTRLPVPASDRAEFFSVTPEEQRIFVATGRNAGIIYYADDYTVDGIYPKGTVSGLLGPAAAAPDAFEWLPEAPYALAQMNGTLSIREMDPTSPQNIYPLMTNVKKFVLGRDLYVLSTSGELSTMRFAP